MMAQRGTSVTIKHVAADAGVSLQTVSRVINKQPNVRPHVADRVRASIEKLGYVPSIAAQQMGGRRSYLIMALNDRERTIADWRERRGSDWTDQMMLGGILAGEKAGYRMVVELVDTHSSQVGRELSAAIAAVRPDGVILTPPHSQNPLILALLEEHGIAVARIGSLAPGPGYCLVMDDAGAARAATAHCAELGHRRIGFIAGSGEYEITGWRIEGWQAEMAKRALPSGGLLERGDFSAGSGAAAAARLLERDDPPTAIIVGNDQMSLAALAEAQQRGLVVPRDLSLISFDNTPMVRLGAVPLTAVDQPIADLVARAVGFLVSSDAMPATPFSIPARLAIRGSTGPIRTMAS